VPRLGVGDVAHDPPLGVQRRLPLDIRRLRTTPAVEAAAVRLDGDAPARDGEVDACDEPALAVAHDVLAHEPGDVAQCPLHP